MDLFIETFHIDWQVIVAQAINFIVVLVIFYFLALKPLKKVMRERTEKIEGGIKDAHTNKELLTATRKEYEAVLAKAREEAHVLFQEGKKEAEGKRTEMLAQANTDVEQMITNGKKILEAEKNKMVEEAKKEIVSLVVRATEKLLEQEDMKGFDEKVIKRITKA